MLTVSRNKVTPPQQMELSKKCTLQSSLEAEAIISSYHSIELIEILFDLIRVN
jgi:hypothetical protein